MNLELTTEEVNRILQIISQAPYNQVADLVQKIHAQAQDKEDGGKQDNN